MYIYKMLCLNRLRECKRMISNLLFPSLFFVFFTGYILFLFTAFAAPAIGDIEGFRPKIYNGLISALAGYSFCCCFFRVKPLIIVKPASISLFCEKRLKKTDRNKIYRNRVQAVFTGPVPCIVYKWGKLEP